MVPVLYRIPRSKAPVEREARARFEPMLFGLSRSLLVLAALALSLPESAWANGQTTHVWIAEEALNSLEAGELKSLLSNPELRDPLLNGAMFPDGGYAVSDHYGELAHWEPFQQAYLQWIRDTFPPPWDEGDAAPHVAFLMGLAAHGLADEVFDSLFMERSRAYDPGWDGGTSNLDTASDVLFAAQVGGITPPESWLPIEAVLPIFNEQLGHSVALETIEAGHNLLFTALAYTEWGRTNDERLATFGLEFPWTEDWINDPEVPGGPRREAAVIARYWEDLWSRLHLPAPVLEMVGEDTWNHPEDMELLEARIHLSFGRGIDVASLALVRAEDSQGRELTIDVDHHYGQWSHAVHVIPEADWPEDDRISISAPAGLLNYDGVESSEAWSASFSTGPESLSAELPNQCSCQKGIPSQAPAAIAIFGLLALHRRRVGQRPRR